MFHLLKRNRLIYLFYHIFTQTTAASKKKLYYLSWVISSATELNDRVHYFDLALSGQSFICLSVPCQSVCPSVFSQKVAFLASSPEHFVHDGFWSNLVGMKNSWSLISVNVFLATFNLLLRTGRLQQQRKCIAAI